MALELPRGAQQPRLQQGDQVEQLLEIVLHRGRREQQDELLLDLAGEFPDLRVAVAQVVGLVDDHHVPLAGQDRRAVRLALGRVDRGDHAVESRPGLRPLLAERRVVVADQLDRELPAHLPLPLLDERRRHQDQDRADQAADHQLGEDQAGLDRLAQADLVAEHGPAAEPPQDGLGRADLVLQRVDVADQRQRDQPVESRVRRQPGGFQGQLEVPQPGRLGRLGQNDGPVPGVELDPHPLLGRPLAIGGPARDRLGLQPVSPLALILQPERGGRIGDDAGQLRDDDRAARGVGHHLHRHARGILEPLDREPIRTEDLGESDPLRRVEPEDLESISGLQGRRGREMGHVSVRRARDLNGSAPSNQVMTTIPQSYQPPNAATRAGEHAIRRARESRADVRAARSPVRGARGLLVSGNRGVSDVK